MKACPSRWRSAAERDFCRRQVILKPLSTGIDTPLIIESRLLNKKQNHSADLNDSRPFRLQIDGSA